MSLYLQLKNIVLFRYYKFRQKTIPGKDYVVRHLPPSAIDSGFALSSGFLYKKDKKTGQFKEKELSVNWLEFLNRGACIKENIIKVRDGFEKRGYTLKINGRFSALNVQNICDEVKEGTKELPELVSLIVKHTPNIDDLSHSSIFGMPLDPEGEMLVSTILANCANESKLYPAKI